MSGAGGCRSSQRLSGAGWCRISQRLSVLVGVGARSACQVLVGVSQGHSYEAAWALQSSSNQCLINGVMTTSTALTGKVIPLRSGTPLRYGVAAWALNSLPPLGILTASINQSNVRDTGTTSRHDTCLDPRATPQLSPEHEAQTFRSLSCLSAPAIPSTLSVQSHASKSTQYTRTLADAGSD